MARTVAGLPAGTRVSDFISMSVLARARTGRASQRERDPLRELHDELVRPIAEERTRGAWCRGRRLVSLGMWDSLIRPRTGTSGGNAGDIKRPHAPRAGALFS